MKKDATTQEVIGELTLLFVKIVQGIHNGTQIKNETNALKEVFDIFLAPGPKGRTVSDMLKRVRTRCALQGLIRVYDFLTLSEAATVAVSGFGIVGVKDIVLRSRKGWLNLAGITPQIVDEIEEALKEHDLRLGMDSDDVRRALGEAVPHCIKWGYMPGSVCAL